MQATAALETLEADIAEVIKAAGQNVHTGHSLVAPEPDDLSNPEGQAVRGGVVIARDRGGSVLVNWRTRPRHGYTEGHTVNSAVIVAGRWFVRTVLEEHAHNHGWTVHPPNDGDEQVGYCGPVRVSWRFEIPTQPPVEDATTLTSTGVRNAAV